MKIIGSDYDGTLNHNGIDDTKRRAIAQWRSAGNLFVLVSGRHATNVRELHLQQQFPCDYFIGSNGAVILNGAGDTVHRDACDPRMLVPLIRYLFELGCTVGLVHAEDFFDVFPDREHCVGERACTLETMPKIGYYTQVSTWRSTEAEAEVIAQKVRERFGDWFNPLQNGNCVDIVRADVNKAKGLYRLLELVGAEYDDMITVGDNINDSDMIREFRSYAMESGVSAIRELANFVTPGVTELIAWELQEVQP